AFSPIIDTYLKEHLFGDSNGDGFTDLFVLTSDAIYLGLGNGTDWDEPIVISTEVSGALRGTLLDIDADGDLDVLVFTSSSCVLLTNDQSNAWPMSIVDLDSSDGYQHFVISDFDNNDLPDLAHVEANNSKVEIRLNNGIGGFNTSEEVSFLLTPSSIAAIDIDGDGDKDLCVESGSCQRWVINTATVGCTDDQACNYNEFADLDNGNCCYGSCGCIDPLANNYDPEMDCGNGTCIYTITVNVFDDLSQDGEMNGQDYFLGEFFVDVEPLGATFITDTNGEFSFEADEGTDLELSVQTTAIYPFHTTIDPLEISLPADYLSENYLMGVAKLEPIPQIGLELLSPGISGVCDWA
ncbi:MAG: FG-GAP repeat domain-containing protein, partial [Flavobacteriales bacterium]